MNTLFDEIFEEETFFVCNFSSKTYYYKRDVCKKLVLKGHEPSKKGNTLERGIEELILSLIHISEPTRPY